MISWNSYLYLNDSDSGFAMVNCWKNGEPSDIPPGKFQDSQCSAVCDYIHDILAKIQCAAGIFIAQQARGIVRLFIVSFCHKQGDSHDMMSIGLSKINKKTRKNPSGSIGKHSRGELCRNILINTRYIGLKPNKAYIISDQNLTVTAYAASELPS